MINNLHKGSTVMKYMMPILLPLAGAIALSGCNSVAVSSAAASQAVATAPVGAMVATQAVVAPIKERVRISAVGYGTESVFEAYTTGQRRLMAIRASKLDAFRALAEEINGVRIEGNTTIGAMAVKNDSFRARVNALVRGARVISVTPMADSNYETVVEVYVDREFFDTYLSYHAETYNTPPNGIYDPWEVPNTPPKGY